MKRSSFIAAALVLAVPALSFATTTTALVPVEAVTINSTAYEVYDLNITTNTTWTNERLDLSLTSGSVYNNTTFGSNFGPPNSTLVGIDPNLANDTYFTMPTSFPNTTSSNAPSSAQDNETATTLGVSWFAPAGTTNNAGTFTIAQITLTSSAVGSYSGNAFDTAAPGVGQAFSGSIGAAAPEPASLGVLSVASLALLARRRRSAK